MARALSRGEHGRGDVRTQMAVPLKQGAVPGGSTWDLTIDTAGAAAVGDTTVVTPKGAPEPALKWCAYVSATGEVTVQLAKVASEAISAANRSWRVSVYMACEPLLSSLL